MPVEVQIPKLGLTMREGTVSEWRVASGSPVRTGDVVMLLTTDKLETEIEAEADGVLQHAVPEGTTLPTGAVAGWLLGEGETPPTAAVLVAPGGPLGPETRPEPSSLAVAAVSRNGGGRILASPNARRVAKDLAVDLASIAGTGPGGRITSEDVEAVAARPRPQPAPAAAPTRRVLASPVARRLAERTGVDLAAVAGSGPGGRITLDDVVAAERGTPSPVAAVAAAGPRAGDTIPLTGMRGIIAERMHASLQEMAQLTLGFDVRMDAALALREQLKQQLGADGAVVPGITDLVVKSVAAALVRHPLLNATVDGGEVRLLEEVNIGVAVALDNGLVVPVIRHADLLPLADLARASARLAEAARTNRLSLDDLEGGTFSVTALGARGVDFFTPVVNPPNVAILGVGRVRDATVWDGDTPQRASVMTLSLTIDHRAVDGAPAADFLGTVRDLLEAPLHLLVA